MRIIAFINQKGGVSKTTGVVNVGYGLAKSKKKVLLVDLDPQAHLTYSLGVPSHELEHTVYSLLKGDSSLQQTIVRRNNVDIIPSTLELSGAEIELSGIPGREVILKEILSSIKPKQYDYILIDCPPSLGLLTLNALTACSEVFIPLLPEFLALHGVRKLIEVIEVIKKRLNPMIHITGVIISRYDNRKNLHKEIVENVREFFGKAVFSTLIRENIAIAEAPSFEKPIYEYRASSNGAADYTLLTKEIIQQEKQ
ncbi:MAG: ParA family protein [Candidatus Kapaibacterium sp.]|jgi:chromosome partitioning protein|nr:AAA family ATPase [Candidatus Kapabacteria bacterium]